MINFNQINYHAFYTRKHSKVNSLTLVSYGKEYYYSYLKVDLILKRS